jgi:hypothetical protein
MYNTGAFGSLNFNNYLWSSTSLGDPAAVIKYLSNDRITLDGATVNQRYGFSVRLVRDLVSPETYVTFTDGVTTYRKGVRSGSFVIDLALTGTGFTGTQGIDWENIYSIS